MELTQTNLNRLKSCQKVARGKPVGRCLRSVSPIVTTLKGWNHLRQTQSNLIQSGQAPIWRGSSTSFNSKSCLVESSLPWRRGLGEGAQDPNLCLQILESGPSQTQSRLIKLNQGKNNFSPGRQTRSNLVKPSRLEHVSRLCHDLKLIGQTLKGR